MENEKNTLKLATQTFFIGLGAGVFIVLITTIVYYFMVIR